MSSHLTEVTYNSNICYLREKLYILYIYKRLVVLIMFNCKFYSISFRARRNVVIFVLLLVVVSYSYMMNFEAHQNVVSMHNHSVYSVLRENGTENSDNVTEVRIICY